MFSDLIDDFDNYSPGPDKFLDVPFVPTDDPVIEAMLNLAELRADDVLYDLGSGDGRIVVAAARDYNASSVGIEIDTVRIADAMEYAGNSRVEFMVDFIEEDIFTADISAATVVTLYLLDTVNVRLRPRLLSELRPGTRIISQLFDMGDWIADEQLQLNGINIYKWIVPAQVEGAWEWKGLDGTLYQVELQQKYQAVTGSAWMADDAVRLESASLCGCTVELNIQENDAAPLRNFTLEFADGELQSILEEV
ncbi:class I SAM-dependent methyltransferase [Pollutimonas harenae]|uniref:Class I SAM-dependent methyltransferase n=1 Tax=Pollutimonas harenae TaxID=657015 RepID=A0A853GS08_9BURK|nr:class I SAM-dependent methyltransferase [Pollutimonas harenae]NYT84971.1 class I SAM-dependent methyltransferase [Pollutimonas harenae]TEA72640.1 class I SAM-dependent methyltransferase [Pollutimonas harenae]